MVIMMGAGQALSLLAPLQQHLINIYVDLQVHLQIPASDHIHTEVVWELIERETETERETERQREAERERDREGRGEEREREREGGGKRGQSEVEKDAKRDGRGKERQR